MTRVPDGERKHASEFRQAALTPSPVCFEQNFRIGVAGKPYAFSVQFLP